MQLHAVNRGKELRRDEKTAFIVAKVKAIVHGFDPQAEIILFGSRARGDWHEESDWDFLVLMEKENANELADAIRLEILHQIELVTFDTIFVLVKHKKVWEEDHAVTTLYKSIEEEGIKV